MNLLLRQLIAMASVDESTAHHVESAIVEAVITPFRSATDDRCACHQLLRRPFESSQLRNNRKHGQQGRYLLFPAINSSTACSILTSNERAVRIFPCAGPAEI